MMNRFNILASRRSMLSYAVAGSAWSTLSLARIDERSKALIEIPIELVGDWRNSAAGDAAAVINRMREACLGNLIMRSDRQPSRLRIDDHISGPPYILLQKRESGIAWIVVDVGTRDWCNLAYQFGHELGHVLANSWTLGGKPGGACQWLEEALVEAFSLRGLSRLAESWRIRPPFPNDSNYATSIMEHRDRLLQPDWKLAQEQKIAAGLGTWFRLHQQFLESHGSVEASRPAVPTILAIYESSTRVVEDLCALNRWPERTHIDLASYLKYWQTSCVELGSSGELPRRLRALFT